MPLIYEELANLRCAERQQEALRHWQIEQALAETRQAARCLTRLARADSGPYTMKERATLVDARGMIRTVCPGEISLVLLPRTDRDAA